MSTQKRKILVVDNYDSFVFNLVQYLQQLGADCTVVRNDQLTVSDADNYDG
ncbi:MAG: anthranilate synthase component II, partial [Actinobacteria bacterium]|nr:anthranilate synthase component II [Actinomycetota bacterium]